MIEWLLHNWEGYVRLRLHGYSPERFLNLCNARGLEVWGLICNRDGDYEFFMTVEGYRRVKPLVRKAQVRLHITGRYGLPFFIYRHRKRWYYGAGIMAFFMVLYVMSLFIWISSLRAITGIPTILWSVFWTHRTLITAC